jgi:hypothetical protein
MTATVVRRNVEWLVAVLFMALPFASVFRGYVERFPLARTRRRG